MTSGIGFVEDPWRFLPSEV